MKRLIFILAVICGALLLTSHSFGQGTILHQIMFGKTSAAPPGTQGCGTFGSYPAISPYDQSTCGDVDDNRPPAPVSPTTVGSCAPTLLANHSYQLTADLTCGLGLVALSMPGPNTVVDLNGHLVQGTVHFVSDTNGDQLYSSVSGDGITCSTDSSGNACVYGNINSQSNFTTLFRLDHFTVQNTAVSTSSARNVFFDYGSLNTGGLAGSPTMQMDHITSTSATGISSSRIVNLQVQATENGTAPQSKTYPVYFNNSTLCLTNTAACQGIVSYGSWATKLYSNSITNQLNNPSSSETPRGMICDQTYSCEIYSNYFNTQDGRAFRYRGTHNTNGPNESHDNILDNIVAGSNGNHVAAVHIGDPDSGTHAENVLIDNNIFNYKSGLIGMSRSATAITVQDNKAVCVGCTGFAPTFWTLRSIDGSTASSINLLRNEVTSIAAPQSSCDSGTTSLVCQSGTASGSCHVDNAACAVFPVPPANAKTWPNLQTAAATTLPWTVCNANNSCAAGTACGIGSASFTPGTTASFTNTNSGGWPAPTPSCPLSSYGWNTLVYRHMGSSWLSDDGTRTITVGTITHATYKVHLKPTFTAGQIVGYEFDPDIFTNTGAPGTWRTKASVACYATNNKWHLYNQQIDDWVSTIYPCTLSSTGSGVAHDIWVAVTFDQSAHTYTYTNLVYDGIQVFGPANAVTYNSEAVDQGNLLNFEVQIDNKNVIGTASGIYSVEAAVW